MDYPAIQTSQTYTFVQSLALLTQHLWVSPPSFHQDRREIAVTAH